MLGLITTIAILFIVFYVIRFVIKKIKGNDSKSKTSNSKKSKKK